MRRTRKSIHTVLSQPVSRAIRASGYSGNYIQTGGGIVWVNGYRFRYIDMEGGMTVFGGSRLSNRPCFILSFDNEDAILQSVESGIGCSLDEGATAKHTVLAAAQLAKERGAKTLIFTDNSTKHLPDGRYFRLSNMYFLTTGKTWYQSILPCTLASPQDEQKYTIWKKRAETNTWSDIYSCLKKEYPDHTIPVGAANQTAMSVLRALKETKTDFFAKYEAELLMCSSIGSLHGLEWRCMLG